MALLPRAALAVALCLAFVPSASASTAPVIRLAGTGEPAIYQDGGLPALETGMSYVEGVSTGVSGFGLVFTDPVDNRVLALAGDQVFVLAGNGDSGAGSDGTGRLTAVVPHPEAISACCQFPLINSYISDYSSSGGYGSHIRTLDTEGAPFPDGFVASAGSNIPKDFSHATDGRTYAAMWGAGTVDRLEFGVIAGGGSRSDLDPIDPNDPLASNLYKPTSVSVSPLSASSLLVSTYLPETPINGYVMKVETFGTDDPSDDTIQIVAGKLMTTELGDGGLAKDGWLLEPSSVVYLKDGGFLVYDAGNARIRRVTAGDIDHATISTIAGNGTSGLAAPGTPANIAPLADAGGTVDGLSLRPADMELTSEGLVMSQGPYGVLQMIPATAITAAPPVLTQSRSASFTLASWDDNATYACKLDGEADFTTCHSYSDLPDGSHTFQAQATTNGGGDVDPSPSTHTWTVDGTPPAAFALASPAAGATVDANPTISWNAATDATTDVARYELWFDHAKAGDVTCCSTQLTNLHDGAHTFQIRAVDSAGNVRESEERSFNVSSAPTASFTIAPTRALIGRNVTFDATKSSDSNGTIVNYAWDLDGDGSFETDTGASPTTARSYAKPQTLTIGLRVTDNDGVTGTAIGQLVVTTQPPVGQQLGVSINDGAQYTNDPGVTVFSVWPGFASDALVSNDGGFKKAVTFPVAEQIAWTLDSSGPERLPKTIYVRFTAGAQVSETYQDDIILDQTPPKVLSASLSSGGTAASAAAAKKVTLKLKAKDNVSGVGGVQVTSNKRKPGKVLKYKKSLKVKAAETLYVRVRDRAGNFSSWRKAKR